MITSRSGTHGVLTPSDDVPFHRTLSKRRRLDSTRHSPSDTEDCSKLSSSPQSTKRSYNSEWYNYGFNDEIVKYAENCCEELNHQTEEYFIKYFIESKIKEQLEDESKPMVERLEYAGFEKEKAKELKNIFEKNDMFHHQMLFYWLENYLDSVRLADYKIPENFKPKNKNRWELKSITQKRVPIPKEIQIIQSQTVQKKKLNELINGSGASIDKKSDQLWFHGAHAKNIVNIAENTIDLERGNKKQQFSRSNGFYLSDRYDAAYKWASRKSDGGPFGVLVYNFILELKANEMQMEAESCILDFYKEYGHGNELDEALEQTIKYCTSEDKEDIENEDLQNLIENAKFLYGPLCTDQGERIKLENKQNVNQLCVKDKDLAKFIDSKLLCIIFIA